ncbi:ester cyclase [Egbenema bharatensis]|uniref:ester cyclase n=1 Tax=Egbenema bharatensis TaxID=3463334 RepID=UPI003A8ADC07
MSTAFSPSTLTKHKQVVEQFLDATHSGNVDVIDTLVSANIMTHNFPGGKSPTSREEYKEFFRLWGRGVPQQTFTVLAIVAEADKVVVHYAITGWHDGDLLGIPATGQKIDFTGVAFYRMENSQIAETWLYPDTSTLLQQIGVSR